MKEAKPLNQLIFQFLQNLGIKAKIEENYALVYWDTVV
jgi:hypothetical protein